MFRILKSKITSIILLVGIGWLSFSAWNIHGQKEKAGEQVSNIRGKIEALEKNNAYVEKLLEYMKNPEYIARQVRAKLNYKAADEEVAYVYLEEAKKATETPREEGQRLVAKVKDWLYNLFH